MGEKMKQEKIGERSLNIMRNDSLLGRGFVVEEEKGFSIYLHPEVPFWFVPTPLSQEILKLSQKGVGGTELAQWMSNRTGGPLETCIQGLDKLRWAVKPPHSTPYKGRRGLPLNQLSEIWFHLTEACNLRCKHCLFGGVSGPARSLDGETVKATVGQGVALGCRLVCFTGGEPLIHPQFIKIAQSILERREPRIAVLTNGLLIPGLIDELCRLDRKRIHFQVSLDGPEMVNDSVRGKGTYQKAAHAVRLLVKSGFPCSIVMAVNPENVSTMPEIVAIAHELGVETVHYMWHFRRGLGDAMEILPMETLVGHFREASIKARRLGVTIDNLEAMRAQVFSSPGTRFDLGNAAWESLTVGPDGAIYPTPAMVNLDRFNVGFIHSGLEDVWRNSPVLKRIRERSLIDIPELATNPWRFIIGGGDLDHCFIGPHVDAKGDDMGVDPYIPLYREMAVMLIEEQVAVLPASPHAGLILRMGDITTDCPSGNDVNFIHCNCLLSVGEGGTRGLVRQFYSDRAATPDETIFNPVHYDDSEISFIPKEGRVRQYGCGSPVVDAKLKAGEVVVDLGSGAGVECFIAAKVIGPAGKVIGIDMTDEMLAIARRSQGPVHDALGFANTEFRKGYLEDIPVEDGTADLVVSNCVVNLSHNKRKVFQEILRILKPGGRFVISDVVAEAEPPLAVRADHKLIGECIGGAMVQDYVFSVLKDTGFVNAQIIKRFPYRTVQGHQFFSLTFSAHRPIRPAESKKADVLYSGPFSAVIADDGTVLRRGQKGVMNVGADLAPETLAQSGVLVLDASSGAATNVEGVSTCACFVPPEKEKKAEKAAVSETGCLACGAPLRYLTTPEDRICTFCGKMKSANAVCAEGHFICDVCHIGDPLEVIRKVCTTTSETDMLRLQNEIRSHASFPLHGPEYHAMVPGIILSTYKNLGGDITKEDILTGIDRGALIPGGSCGFMGVCGAAAGAGIAFAIILKSTPLEPVIRQIVQRLTGEIIGVLAHFKAARCCLRECSLAFKYVAKISSEVLPVKLRADLPLRCEQSPRVDECIKEKCPLYTRG